MMNFFTDLDSIMDTRLSTLYAISPDIAIEVLTNGEYVNRKKNNFKNISFDIFNTMYRNRTKYMLAITTVTDSLNLLSQFIIESMSEIKNVEHGLHSEVYINLYPYNLNYEEQDNLRNLFLKLLPTFVEIKFVNITLEEITPEWLSTKANNLMLYNGMDWLEHHSSNNNIIRKPLPETILYLPTISNGITDTSKLDSNFYETLTNSLGGLITIISIDTKYFCSKLKKINNNS